MSNSIVLYPLDDVATCVSVAPKTRSFPKIFLGTFENAAPEGLSSHTTCNSASAAAAAQRPRQPCDRDGFRNRVTLTFDLLTDGSRRAERLS